MVDQSALLTPDSGVAPSSRLVVHPTADWRGTQHPADEYARLVSGAITTLTAVALFSSGRAVVRAGECTGSHRAGTHYCTASFVGHSTQARELTGQVIGSILSKFPAYVPSLPPPHLIQNAECTFVEPEKITSGGDMIEVGSLYLEHELATV